MCGIYGMMGTGILAKDFKIFRDLGTFSQSRGTDGAGVYQVRSIDNPNNPDNLEQMYKSGEPFSAMMNEIDDLKAKHEGGVHNMLSNIFVDVVMGHNRAATVGDITQDNAHPFSLRGIIGAHNGTLRDGKYTHETKTDSEMMFEDIAERGLGTVLTELNPKSAFAISMFNRETKSMYFVRNDDRPLGMAFSQSRAVLYWSSELDMLKYALHRNGETYKAFNINPFKVIKVYAGDITQERIEKDASSIFNVTEIITQKTPEPVKEEPKKAIPFVQGNTSNTYHANCVCGQRGLNLIDIRFAKAGKHQSYTYVEADGHDYYFCDGCYPVGKAH